MQEGLERKLSLPNRSAIGAMHAGNEENHEYFCNAVRYEAGPLTTVSPPVLIIAAVCAIPKLSTICNS
jgi:hypothetical protein